MNNRAPLIAIPVIVTVAFATGIAIGLSFNRRGSASPSTDKMQEIMELIDTKYVDHVDLDSLWEETIPSLLENLDPHTAYIPARDLEEVNSDLQGSFSGVGISFRVMNDTITVVEVISGGPSEKVGLMAGDRIVEVNDSTVAGNGITSDAVMKLLRGPANTEVKLGIRRSTSAEPLTFTVTRGDIPVTSIDASYMIDDSIGYIRVNKFGRTTFEEFFTQMLMLRAAGAENLILDLRGNGGGYLDVAIRMANEFLEPHSGIVAVKGRDAEVQEEAVADGTGAFRKGDVVVLLDEYSASASEIVAGALQDNDRALIVGRRSFGKGLVQQQFELNDSSALRITTARYYTPSGRSIQKPYIKGKSELYAEEILDRYLGGEAFSADSVKFDDSLRYTTSTGRTVYGGGGIMPDLFVPTDTANYTPYLNQVINSGTIHRFAFTFTDRNRAALEQASTSDDVLALLPSDDALLQQFVNYAAANGIPARWYYINLSRPLLINQLKALIARDALGTAAYYEIANRRDPVVTRAVEAITSGTAAWPLR